MKNQAIDWAAIAKRNNFSEYIRADDFVDTGLPLFESEDLTSELIRIYLGLITGGWVGESQTTPFPIDGLGFLYTVGLWLPCVSRVAIRGQIDIRNDGLPEFGAIPISSNNGIRFCFANKISQLPRGWSAVPGNAYYWIGKTKKRNMDRNDRRLLSDEVLQVGAWYFSVVGDRLVPAKGRDGFPNGTPAAVLCEEGAAAIQTVADFKHLWIVETEEQTLSHTKTPLRLGVDSEIIKSLFYARQAPLSASGRKRPILHWVRSHQRRIRDGIEIDVSKHLRGITEFEMDGFPFRVMQPTRP